MGTLGRRGRLWKKHRGIGATVYGEQDRKEVNLVSQDGKTQYITVEDQSVLSDVEAGIAEVLIFSTSEEPRSDQGLSAQCISLIICSGRQVKMPVKMMSRCYRLLWNKCLGSPLGILRGGNVVHVNITRQMAKKAQQPEGSPNCTTLSSEIEVQPGFYK